MPKFCLCIMSRLQCLGTENRASIEPGSVYTRRRNAGKGKSKENAIVEPMTCPPMPKRSIFE